METDWQDRGSDGRMRERHQGVNANSLLAKTFTTSPHLISHPCLLLPPFLPPPLLFSCLPTSQPHHFFFYLLFPSSLSKFVSRISPYLLHFLLRPSSSPIFLYLSPETNILAEIRVEIASSLNPSPPAVAKQGTSQYNGCVFMCD